MVPVRLSVPRKNSRRSHELSPPVRKEPCTENPNKIKGLCTTRPTFPTPPCCEQLPFSWAHLSIITQGVGLTLKRQLSGGFTHSTPGTDSYCHPSIGGHCQQWFQLEADPLVCSKGGKEAADTRKQLLPAPAMTETLPASTFPHPVKQMFFLAAGQSGITSHGSRRWLGILREVRLTLNFHFLIH